jgi:hypothetical protein
VSFIVCIALCVVFYLSVVCYFCVICEFFVLCLIVVPLPPGINPSAVQLNNNNNNDNSNICLLPLYSSLSIAFTVRRESVRLTIFIRFYHGIIYFFFQFYIPLRCFRVARFKTTCLETVGASTSHSHMDLHGLLQEYFCFSLQLCFLNWFLSYWNTAIGSASLQKLSWIQNG